MSSNKKPVDDETIKIRMSEFFEKHRNNYGGRVREAENMFAKMYPSKENQNLVVQQKPQPTKTPRVPLWKKLFRRR
ncbi:MAG: hypothetical protein WC915_02835 [archaeon]|jgi:hypothetical protein